MSQALDLGNLQLRLILDARGQIDGNAVFFPATQEEWSPGLDPDAQGNVPMAVNGLLISDGDEHTLIDTGFGDQERADRPERLVEKLAEIGLQPTDIGRVILTHAHGDHALGNTLKRSGRWVPTFPSAEYVIQEKEIAAIRDKQDAFWRTRFQPLVDCGLLRTIDGPTEMSDILTCWPTPGHTIGHQAVLIHTHSQQALAIGDLVIFAEGFEHPEWGPNWAWSRQADAESRRKVSQWAVETGAILIVAHDPRHPWITLEHAGEGYRFADVVQAR